MVPTNFTSLLPLLAAIVSGTLAIPQSNWGPGTTPATVTVYVTATSATAGVTTITLPASSSTSVPGFSTMDSSQIMSMYSSVASGVNNDAMQSMSSIMHSAQSRNEQYYYYANWYMSSNAAGTATATAALGTTTMFV